MLERLLERLAEHPEDEGAFGVLADWILEQPAPIDALWRLSWRGQLQDARRHHARLVELLLGERASELPSPVLQYRLRSDGQLTWRASPWESADPGQVRFLADRGLRSVGLVGWSAFLDLLFPEEPLPLSRIWPLRLDRTEDLPLPPSVTGLGHLTHLAIVGPAEDTPLHALAQRLLDLPLPLRVLRLETWVPPPEPEAPWRSHPTLEQLEWRGGASGPDEVSSASLPPLLVPLRRGEGPPDLGAWNQHLDSAASAPGARHPWAAATTCGPVRSHNEDTFAVHPEHPVWTVVDGMGGQGTGAPAAALIAEALREPGPARPRFAAASEQLRLRNWSAGGAAVRLVLEGATVQLAWMGDVRAYLLRDGRIEQLTEDHTLVWEAMKRGLLQPWETHTHPHSNILVRSLVGDAVEPEERALALLPGDQLLAVTDGVSDALDDLVMNAIVQESASMLDAVVALVSEACRCLGTDNATALLVELGA